MAMPRSGIALRDATRSRRLFWKDTAEEQTSLNVTDQNADYWKKDLSANEVAVLALNELAAEKGRGFFYHLPSRFAWTTTPDHNRLPSERAPATPT